MCCTDKPMWLSGGGVTMVVVVKKRRKASAALALVLCGAAVGGCLASAGGRDSCDGGAFVEDREGTTVLAMDRLPYMVSIRSHGSRDHVCSGVLLSAFHILTVAHCVDPTSSYSAGPRPTVYIGSTSADAVNDDPNVEVRVVARTHFHESWSPSKIQNCPNNLALLTVERAVNKTPVRLLTDHFRLTTGQTLAAAGWGAGPQGPRLGEGIFGTLKAEAQQFLDSSACNRTSLWSGAVREGTVCGLSREAAASCIVDSGSPLLQLDMPQYNLECGDPALDFLVGLNVDGAPCGTPAKPDMYVDLRPHAGWIELHTKPTAGGGQEL